jgi:hypothetical protein
MPGRLLTWLALLVLAVVVVTAGGSTLLGTLRDLPDAVASGSGGGQSASQISNAEFAEVEVGAGTAAVRAVLGEPEAEGVHLIEGLELECWYYGAGGKTGAYQLCFEDGRLHTKAEFS